MQLSRICRECDGRISADSTHCPYCGQKVEIEKNTVFEKEIDEHDHFSPPYKVHGYDDSSELSEQVKRHTQTSTKKEEVPQDTTQEKSSDGREILLMLLLSIAINMAGYGLFLVLFAINGSVTLQFSSRYALLYLGFGVAAAAYLLNSFAAWSKK